MKDEARVDDVVALLFVESRKKTHMRQLDRAMKRRLNASGQRKGLLRQINSLVADWRKTLQNGRKDAGVAAAEIENGKSLVGKAIGEGSFDSLAEGAMRHVIALDHLTIGVSKVEEFPRILRGFFCLGHERVTTDRSRAREARP